jgi:anti-sigma regulatory factor (Ser/Thr protein kinase)
MTAPRPRLGVVDRHAHDAEVHYQVLAMQPGAGAPGCAREALRAWLAQDGLAAGGEVVLLAGSELVTNAVVHAGTEVELTYIFDGQQVEIAVHDAKPGGVPPAVPAAAAAAPWAAVLRLAAGGRGLGIVDTVADDWGVTHLPDGKRVWARWTRSHLGAG